MKVQHKAHTAMGTLNQVTYDKMSQGTYSMSIHSETGGSYKDYKIIYPRIKPILFKERRYDMHCTIDSDS